MHKRQDKKDNALENRIVQGMHRFPCSFCVPISKVDSQFGAMLKASVLVLGSNSALGTKPEG